MTGKGLVDPAVKLPPPYWPSPAPFLFCKGLFTGIKNSRPAKKIRGSKNFRLAELFDCFSYESLLTC